MNRQNARRFIRERLLLATPAGLPALQIFTAHPGSGLRRLTGAATPYWAYCWPGGAALARFVSDFPAIVTGRQVLDLGCGSGLVALAAARAGAAQVFAFDSDPLARVATELNAEANEVSVAVLADLLALPPGLDLVSAGDVFYSAAPARKMQACLRRFRDAGAEVLVGDPGREYLPRESLRELARFPVREFGGDPATGFVFAFEPERNDATSDRRASCPSQRTGMCSMSAASNACGAREP